MSDITVRELLEKKRVTELRMRGAISSLIETFVEETGVNINGVSVLISDVTILGGDRKEYDTIDARVNLDLDRE